MKNKTKLFYWIVTGLFSLMMIFSAYNFIFNYEDTSALFSGLGMPTLFIYPVAIAKILGLIAIWTRYSKLLKEWAYAGFFFNFILALLLHIKAEDGQWFMAVIAVILLFASYALDYEVYSSETE